MTLAQLRFNLNVQFILRLYNLQYDGARVQNSATPFRFESETEKVITFLPSQPDRSGDPLAM